MPDKMRLGSWFGLIRTGTDRSFGSGQRPINCLGHWRNSCCSSNSNLMSDELQVHNDAFWRYFFLLKAKTIFSGTIKLWHILISILLIFEKEIILDGDIAVSVQSKENFNDQQCFAFTLCPLPGQLKPKFKCWQLLAGLSQFPFKIPFKSLLKSLGL